MLQPLVKVKGFQRYKRYNLADLAPLEMDYDIEEDATEDLGETEVPMGDVSLVGVLDKAIFP